MAKLSRLEVLNTVREQGLVPLFFTGHVETGIGLLEACYKGGARVAEFTSRGDFAHEVFSKLSAHVSTHMPDMALGVGSITDAATASHYMLCGADFIVTASLREDIAMVCNRRKVPYMPGCGSLTEINRAEELGCEIIKLFPGSTYGPGFIKAIRGPQPWTSLMPTGGVDTSEENLTGWFHAGAVCVGMGSKLISRDIIENRLYDVLEERVAEVIKTIRKIRTGTSG